MWALLDSDNKVIGVIEPSHTEEEAKKIAEGKTIIRMTVENSPAYLLGYYRDGQFYHPETGENV